MVRLKHKHILTILLGVTAILAALLFICPTVHAAPAEEGASAETAAGAEGENTKPTLNAAVSDKALSIHAVSDNGIKTIYVNGYAFHNTGNGNLKIRLQQFDAGYNKFYIYAEDNEGNVSDVYEVENPYYDEDKTDDKDPSKELPVDASATDPTEAVGVVSEHLFNGGREFYQIETANGKVFYLIVDMLSDEEKVYFLTEISERDLLNATNDASETLPRNSAIPEDGIPEGVIVNNNVDSDTMETLFAPKGETVQEESADGEETGNSKEETKKTGEKGEEKMATAGISTTTIIYIIMGVVCVGVIVGVSMSKKKKRNKKKDSPDTPEEQDNDDDEE